MIHVHRVKNELWSWRLSFIWCQRQKKPRSQPSSPSSRVVSQSKGRSVVSSPRRFFHYGNSDDEILWIYYYAWCIAQRGLLNIFRVSSLAPAGISSRICFFIVTMEYYLAACYRTIENYGKLLRFSRIYVRIYAHKHTRLDWFPVINVVSFLASPFILQLNYGHRFNYLLSFIRYAQGRNKYCDVNDIRKNVIYNLSNVRRLENKHLWLNIIWQIATYDIQSQTLTGSVEVAWYCLRRTKVESRAAVRRRDILYRSCALSRSRCGLPISRLYVTQTMVARSLSPSFSVAERFSSEAKLECFRSISSQITSSLPEFLSSE